jgi:osmotically-inducible protein OsmY
MGLLGLLAACAHAPAKPEAKADALGAAYRTVASGARETAHAGGYLVERASGADVRVVHEAPVGGLQRDVSDARITSDVKARLGADRETPTRDVQVGADAGVVKLSGYVSTEGEAMNAIRDALATDGVTAVDARLRWPTQQATAKTYGK